LRKTSAKQRAKEKPPRYLIPVKWRLSRAPSARDGTGPNSPGVIDADSLDANQLAMAIPFDCNQDDIVALHLGVAAQVNQLWIDILFEVDVPVLV
jgi:hypothetical protein